MVHWHLATTADELNYIGLTLAIIDLCKAIDRAPVDEETWSLGENAEFTLSVLIVGAFWHYSEWHAVQDSVGYLALSALGSIFSPDMSGLPLEGEHYGEYPACMLVNSMAKDEGIL